MGEEAKTRSEPVVSFLLPLLNHTLQRPKQVCLSYQLRAKEQVCVADKEDAF